DGDDRAGARYGHIALPLAPRRSPEVAVAVRQPRALPAGKVRPPDVSEARLIGDGEDRRAVRGEERLGDGGGAAAGDNARPGHDWQPAFGEGEFREAKLGAVPRHVRVVPLDPGGLRAIGAPGWLHIEVAAFSQPLWPVLAFGIDDRDDVDVLIRVH